MGPFFDSWRLAGLVLFTGIFSNVAQALVEGAYFLGISGVVYGLFGYAWIKSNLEPNLGIHVSPVTTAIMMISFFLGVGGFFNSMGINVANTAHGAGLVAGVLIAYIPHFKE